MCFKFFKLQSWIKEVDSARDKYFFHMDTGRDNKNPSWV